MLAGPSSLPGHGPRADCLFGAQGTVQRLRLPSGGWWDLETRPRWRHLSWLADDTDADPGVSQACKALAALTEAWSFHEEVTPEAVASREPNDLVIALQALLEGPLREVVCPEPKDGAEELFEALARGRVPPAFAEVHIMAATGWAWSVLQETPLDVVERMLAYLAVRQALDSGGHLDFPEGQGE